MTMTEEEIFDKLTTMIADRFEVEKADITRETSFKDDLKADSIDLVELILEMEEEFGKEIPDEDAENITTVGQAVDYISKNQD